LGNHQVATALLDGLSDRAIDEQFVVNGEVYDGTEYLNEHPGGAESILLMAGDDASDDFMAIHSIDAKRKLQQYHIGTLVKSSESEADASQNVSDVSSTQFLQPKVWKTIKLTEARRINHDVFLYRFSLGSDLPLGLPIGHHVFIRLKDKDTGETVQRAYTPVSEGDAVGSIDFLIKSVETDV